MGHKRADGSLHCTVLDAVEPGETFYVLRGDDVFAPPLVKAHAELIKKDISSVDYEKIWETARQMEVWWGKQTAKEKAT